MLTPRNILIFAVMLVCAAAFWSLGSHIELSGDRPFVTIAARALAIIVAVLVVVGFVALLDAWSRRRTRRLMALAGQPAVVAAAAAEAVEDETELCISEAVAWSTQREKRPDRLGPGPYAMPWIMVVGSADSGRSSLVSAALLENAGTVREAGGTRFILSDEAVLIEAATMIAVEGADQDSWTSLFRLLAQARPRRPVDAVVLTEPVGEMLGFVTAGGEGGPGVRGSAGSAAGGPAGGSVGGVAAARARGDVIGARGTGPAMVARVRLQQAMRVLGTTPPVYIAVTQCDRLLGFSAGSMGWRRLLLWVRR